MRSFSLSALAALALPALFSAAPAAAQPARSCHYDIRLHDPAALILDVTARCDDTGPVAFDRPGEAGMAAALERFEPGADGRSVQYRFRLGDLAASPEVAQRIGPAVISPLSVWLSPPDLPGSTAVTLSVTAGDGLDIATGLPQRDGLLRMTAADLPYGGFAVFGRFTRRLLPAGGDAKIELVGFPGRLQLDDATIDTWVTDSAKAVSQYYGHFPLRHTLILATPVRGRAGIQFGQVRGGGGGTMLLQIGEQATRAQLYDGWILVHEMIHLGAPFVTGRSFWLMEGMATYGEPVIRARAGWYPVPQMWHEFASQMPRGVDALTIQSLDAVTRRGIYWGGAIFMLLADIDIRERSHSRASLETCFRAVLNDGGNTTVRWPRAEFLRVCDAATGTGTMARLAARYVTQAAPLDLNALWRDLGVKLTADGVQFDDAAPKAALRRAITAGS
ncbi:hypothetical protein [Ferrovibrio xuzhouensis]|uniref:Peptidase M61 catalytic domain-containing protein n=1 Tax=Ferrovibrio xuzhouensis TaxID=1576914 RepID=A0ABV7VHS4_9PROT